MDLEELIVSRRTVHNYTADKVDDALVKRALELSLWAPNHKLTFPWTYIQLGPTVRQQLAELAVELKSARGALNDIKRKAIAENVTTPSHLILLARHRSEGMTAHEDYATLSCSVQIASEFLWSHKISTKWSTGGWSMNARTYELCGLSRESFELEGALMIGHAAIIPKAPERPELARVLKTIA